MSMFQLFSFKIRFKSLVNLAICRIPNHFERKIQAGRLKDFFSDGDTMTLVYANKLMNVCFSFGICLYRRRSMVYDGMFYVRVTDPRYFTEIII